MRASLFAAGGPNSPAEHEVQGMQFASTDTAGFAPEAPPALASLQAANRQLQADLEQVKADRDRLFDIQRRLMEVLGTPSPDRLVHDLRNVLNERELFKALADAQV